MARTIAQLIREELGSRVLVSDRVDISGTGSHLRGNSLSHSEGVQTGYTNIPSFEHPNFLRRIIQIMPLYRIPFLNFKDETAQTVNWKHRLLSPPRENIPETTETRAHTHTHASANTGHVSLSIAEKRSIWEWFVTETEKTHGDVSKENELVEILFTKKLGRTPSSEALPSLRRLLVEAPSTKYLRSMLRADAEAEGWSSVYLGGARVFLANQELKQSESEWMKELESRTGSVGLNPEEILMNRLRQIVKDNEAREKDQTNKNRNNNINHDANNIETNKRPHLSRIQPEGIDEDWTNRLESSLKTTFKLPLRLVSSVAHQII